MRRVWASMVAVWATLAIVAVLAWSQRPQASAPPQAAPQTLVVKSAHGKRQVYVVATNAAPHTTTHSSPAPR